MIKQDYYTTASTNAKYLAIDPYPELERRLPGRVILLLSKAQLLFKEKLQNAKTEAFQEVFCTASDFRLQCRRP